MTQIRLVAAWLLLAVVTKDLLQCWIVLLMPHSSSLGTLLLCSALPLIVLIAIVYILIVD